MNKKVVVLGGGTGLSAMLRGIKYIEGIDISAIVTVADSGGSTGILTKHFNIPAVGDLRRVIAALSRNREQLEESMEYRIKGTESDLDGHTVGNLILASQIKMHNDFAKGIQATTKMLNVEGSIIPVSNHFNHLQAELEDGTIVEGEDNIGHSNGSIKRVFYKEGNATPEAVKALEEADYIFLGIGSLYTSLIANLIYTEIREALKNTKAKIIYFANIFTQHGETDNMTLSDHINAIEKHTHAGMIDEVIISSTPIEKNIIDSYLKDKQEIVQNDYKGKTREFDLIDILNFNMAKHGEKKLEKAVKEIING